MLNKVENKLEKLEKSFDNGKIIKDGIKTTISFKTEKTSLNSDKTLYPLVISAYLCTPISPE